MKLLAFTDMHLSSTAYKKIKSKTKKQNPDLLICAGDVSIFEEGLDLMLDKLSKIKKNILMIHGNHEADTTLRKLCKKYKYAVIDKTQKSYVFEVSALKKEIDQLIKKLQSLGLASVSRTGVVAMTKGSEIFKQN